MNSRMPRRAHLLELADRTLGHVPLGWEAVIRVERHIHSLTRFANSRIHQNVTDDRLTIAVTLADGGRVATVSGNQARRDADLAALVDQARHAATLLPPEEAWPGVASPAPVTPAGHWDEATASAEPRQRALRVADFVAGGGGTDIEAAGFCDSEAWMTAVVTTAGQHGFDRGTRASVDGVFLAPREGAYTPAGCAHGTSARLADLDAEPLGQRAAQTALAARGASDLEPGDYEVVLAPECVATMAEFLGGYGFNAKACQEGQSFVEIGAEHFDGAFHLVDDVHHPDGVGTALDAEGVPRRSVELVDLGRCAAVVHDRRTAARAGVVSTGHATPASAVWGPDAANLVVGRGTATPEELIAAVPRGVYVTSFNYCRVLDPKTVAVTGLTRNGTFLIEDGRIGPPITNLRFTQSFVDALGPGRVLGIGSDARLAAGEFGVGRVVAPTLRLARFHFTGGAAG